MDFRKTYSLLYIVFILLSVGMFCSCKHAPDACATEYCLNGASCSNGRCSCPLHFVGEHCDSCMTGYEGSDCITQVRSKFIYYNYIVTESKDGSAPYTYASQILVTNAAIDQVALLKVDSSFFLNTVAATCRGNYITIPKQCPDIYSTYFIEGTGSISGGVINFQYMITDSISHQIRSFVSTWSR
jgi:hypothetical protein